MDHDLDPYSDPIDSMNPDINSDQDKHLLVKDKDGNFEYEIVFTVDDTECLICIEPLDLNGPYAMIDDVGENNKYHIGCLEDWFKFNRQSIINRKEVNFYSIYHDGEFVEKRELKNPQAILVLPNRNRIINDNVPTIEETQEQFSICTGEGLRKIIVTATVLFLFLIVIYFIFRRIVEV